MFFKFICRCHILVVGWYPHFWRGQIWPNPKVSQQTFATPPKTSPVTSDQRFSLLHFVGEICRTSPHDWLVKMVFHYVKLPFFAKSRVFSGFGSAPWRTLLLSPRMHLFPQSVRCDAGELRRCYLRLAWNTTGQGRVKPMAHGIAPLETMENAAD